MENNIPTAEEFLLAFESDKPKLKAETSTKEDKDSFYSSAQGAQVTIDLMIGFAKLHVEKLAENVSKNSDAYWIDKFAENYIKDNIK